MKKHRHLVRGLIVLLLVIWVSQLGTPMQTIQAAEDPSYGLTGDQLTLKVEYNMRNSASATDRGPVDVPAGSTLTIENQYTASVNHGGGNKIWYKVTYGGRRGWIFADPPDQTIRHTNLNIYAQAGDSVTVFTGIGYNVRTAQQAESWP